MESKATVLVIGASPRTGGNSDLLMDQVLQECSKLGFVTEIVYLRDMDMVPCDACGGCSSGAGCVKNDDMQNLHSLLSHADGLILVSPLYFQGLPAVAKGMVDRCQPLWLEALKRGGLASKENRKPGAFICVGGAPKGDPGAFDGATKVVKAFFAVCGFNYNIEELVCGAEKKGDVLAIDGLFDRVADIAREIAQSA